MKYIRILFFLSLYLPLNASSDSLNFEIYDTYADFVDGVQEEIASGKTPTYALPNDLLSLPSDEAELRTAALLAMIEAAIEDSQIDNPSVNCPGVGFTEQQPHIEFHYMRYFSPLKFYMKGEAWWLAPDGICKRKIVDGSIDFD